jgi:acetyl-CoA synthetase
VATLMGKSGAYLISLMAIWRLGAVQVPLFTALAPPAIDYRLRASGCRLVVCDAGQRAKLAAIDDRSGWRTVVNGPADEEAPSLEQLIEAGRKGAPPAALGGSGALVQLYTSGTTGKPKGVIAPIRALAAFHAYLEFGLDVRCSDVFWNAADPGWAYGLYYGVLAPLAAGRANLLLDAGFSPETTFEALDRFGVTNFAAAPTVYRALRASGLRPRRRGRLRCASSAGEPLTPEVNQWARKGLGVEVRDHYGQTEAGMLINNHQQAGLRRPLKPGSMGRPMPGWSVCVLDETGGEARPGELGRVAVDLGRSPLAWFFGYAGTSDRSGDRFSADGRWYFTGDVGRTDEDGDFYFSARDDDVIIMAGYRIGPSDVEAVMLQHPAVAECAVVAAPDEIRGEVVEAVVALRPGYRPSDALTAEIQEQVRRGYGAHAYPRRVHYVDALPRTPSGKVQRFLLRRQLGERPAASARS